MLFDVLLNSETNYDTLLSTADVIITTVTNNPETSFTADITQERYLNPILDIKTSSLTVTFELYQKLRSFLDPSLRDTCNFRNLELLHGLQDLLGLTLIVLFGSDSYLPKTYSEVYNDHIELLQKIKCSHSIPAGEISDSRLCSPKRLNTPMSCESSNKTTYR